MSRSVSQAEILSAIAQLLEAAPTGKSLSPDEVARAVAGADGKSWGPLMGRVRATLIEMAGRGEIVLLRKGKPIEAADLRGVYRFRRAGSAGPVQGDETDESAGD